MSDIVPRFEPHPLLRGGDVQTIGGVYLPGRRPRLPSVYHELPLEDGDRLTLLDSVPAGWSAGDPAAVLVHGLTGCSRAPYVARVADRLAARGVRVVRMNLRGAGSSFGLSRGIYHSGRTEDVRAVVEWTARRSPGSPVGMVGFSLGGNLVLKLAAEASEHPLPGLDCVLAANPPIDLSACCRNMMRPRNRLYDKNFIRSLRRDIARLHAAFPDLGPVDLGRVRSLYEFDDCYTAPRNGFSGAEDYYARCSCGPMIPRITLPGLVVHAEDDPFIPAEPFRMVRFPPRLALELIPSGGHLGYLSRSRWGGDRRWLDARLVAWLLTHWSAGARERPGAATEGGGLREFEGGCRPDVQPQTQ
jgi:predicted alpha/beta-fold hydrolase